MDFINCSYLNICKVPTCIIIVTIISMIVCVADSSFIGYIVPFPTQETTVTTTVVTVASTSDNQGLTVIMK